MNMQTKPQLFAFEQDEKLSSVRVVTDSNNNIWFVANDVCAALQIANSRNVVERLDEDEKGVHSMDTLGGKQEMNCINESGVYSLILTSRKPSAKKFKKWVTSEVLPSIRKTGAYKSDGISLNKQVELQRYSHKLISDISKTAEPFIRDMLYQDLQAVRGWLGTTTPPLESLILSGVADDSQEIIEAFFNAICYLEQKGELFNQHAPKTQLAVHLDTFLMLCEKHNVPMVKGRTLTRALRQSPRLIAASHNVNSTQLSGKVLKCWVFNLEHTIDVAELPQGEVL
ncbi:Bro-N domain-containing protein [Pseudoalteromonas sp. MMG013]|uniref:BRO-N domain-containing protein n=1 Tax=Pseudoalteromonas sp. MMG013 TaxID=2822687 RepID=UPI001B367F02|nr:Bro-N domain-containing protein [Pseudoalteromonas sp. MMG013]MBQ4864583.1 Bro-N domain-containing protein [Pseudoalteromonas sp. MMG013]